MKLRDWTVTSAKYSAAFVLGAASLGGIAWSLNRRPAAAVHTAPATPASQAIAPLTPVTATAELPPKAPIAIEPPVTQAETKASVQVAPPPIPNAGPAEGHKVNLNTATQAELELLPGIGPALAQRILEHRATHGKFATVERLDEVKGIGPRTLAKLRPLVSVE